MASGFWPPTAGSPVFSSVFRSKMVTELDCPLEMKPLPTSLATAMPCTSFRPRLAKTPLRFANPSPPSGWIRDSHPQTVEHARHTMTVGAKPCGFRPHLGNRCAIPTFPPPRRLLDCFLNSNPERSFPQPSAQASFRLILRLEKTSETHLQEKNGDEHSKNHQHKEF